MDVETRSPACIQCRKRKRKCSRGTPCKRCKELRLDCSYQRIKSNKDVISALDCRVQKLESLYHKVNRLEELLLASQRHGLHDGLRPQGRVTASSPVSSSSFWSNGGDSASNSNSTYLPPIELLYHIVDIYFDQIHPWIPILHMPSFINMVHTSSCDAPIIVLQAIVSVTVKFVKMTQREQSYYSTECRKAVVLSSMDRFSIESLQASIILAFETTGCGRGPRSWSIVSSATRLLEQLGLACEEDEIEKTKLMNRIGFLKPSASAAEMEARRRIFWAVFLMDRFCSTTTGWNTSMTSSQIHRRLPMEGLNFAHNDNKKARYFCISESTITATDNREDDEDALGGYSYLVEATECLSRVVSFLLHESLSVGTLHDLNTWLSKFMSLNSMLVRWKAALPEKWRSLKPTARGLDENAALAYVTHDTSVLLLHHNLAYPPAELLLLGQWRQSIQICVSTAVEIATITEQFLRRVKIVVAPQFCFCAFIAGRTLLANHLRGNSSDDIARKFDSLVESLNIMARRWTANGNEKGNLAAIFALRLETAKDSKNEIDVRKAVFSDDDELYNGNASLTSPPVADLIIDRDRWVNGQHNQNSNVDGDVNRDRENTSFQFSDLKSIEELANISEFDYIFGWEGHTSV